MKINIIVAHDLDRNIGRDGGLPWKHAKEDMAHFNRNTTAGSNPALIMGRKTWESLPERHRPLKDRMNIVVSSTMDDSTEDGCSVVKTIGEGVTLAKLMNVDTLWVIGGAGVYKEFMSNTFIVDCIYATVMNQHYEGCDTRFLELPDNYVVDHVYPFYDEDGGHPFTFNTFKRQ
jgi:dihydrofolate reductase